MVREVVCGRSGGHILITERHDGLIGGGLYVGSQRSEPSPPLHNPCEEMDEDCAEQSLEYS